MRIANMMLSRKQGGIEQAGTDYANALASQGNNVCYITDQHMAPLLAESLSPAIQHHRLRQWGSWDRLAGRRIRQQIRSHRSQCVLVHGNRALQLAALANIPNIPLIALQHNYHMQHTHKADVVFCITHHMRDALIARGVKPESCHHMPNMVQVPASLPERSYVFQRPVHIGAMGRLVKKKGFDDWLRALAGLRDQGIPFTATLGGEGEEKAALQALLTELSLNDQVSIIDWIKDTRQWYRSIDIFCLPSRHEPFGIVLIEAMAAGVPVIATATEGPSDILADARHGLVIPAGDPESMTRAISTLIHSPDMGQHLAKQAYEHVKSTYDIPVRARAIHDALQSCLDSSSDCAM